jgi:hypothetical protein
MANNAEFYRGLLLRCAEPFGTEVRTSDDGSVQDEPLVLKIPELVAAVAAREQALQSEIYHLHNAMSGFEAVTDPFAYPELFALSQALLASGQDGSCGNPICEAVTAQAEEIARLKARALLAESAMNHADHRVESARAEGKVEGLRTFRIMRWWLNDDTPADCWRVEQKLASGIWIRACGCTFESREEAEIAMETLTGKPKSGFELHWTVAPRKFPTLAVVAWTVAVGLVVYGLAFFLR